MSSINSNSGHFDNLNSSIVPLDVGDSFIGAFSSCLNFAVIDVSIKCDSEYLLEILYSHDGINEDFIDSVSVTSVSSDTLFYEFRPKMRYYKIKIENTDSIDQTVLILQTLLKSTVTYQVGGNTPSSNVTIVNPLNLDGSVFVGGSVDISGQVVDISGQTVDISGQVVDISGQTVDISGQTVVVSNLSNKNYFVLWNNNLTGANGTSLIANLSNANQSNLTIYGIVNAPTQLIVQFSNDGANFYDSQYSYNQSSAGDYGFNITACPRYVRLKSTESVDTYSYLNYY